MISTRLALALYVDVCLVGATLPRVINGPEPVSCEEEETLHFKPVGVNTLDSGTGKYVPYPCLFVSQFAN